MHEGGHTRPASLIGAEGEPAAEGPRRGDEPYNAAADLLERNLAAGRGGRPYLVTDERTWSYQEVAETAAAVGVGLRDLGLAPGDRVLIALRDRPEFVLTFWGALRAGLVPVPLAVGLSADDVRFVIDDSEARLVVCEPSTAAAVLAVSAASTEAPAPRHAVALAASEGAPPAGVLPWSYLIAPGSTPPPEATTADDPALWLYTSGTTGVPKAVVHRHAHLRAGTRALSAQVIGLTSDDVVLSVSKMFFAYGLGNSVYQPAAVGAAVVVDDEPAVAARVEARMHETRPTVLLGVPAFFRGMLALTDAELPPTARMVLSAGEALSADLFEGFRARFGHTLLDGLGATEALHHVTSNRPDDALPGTAGRALDGYAVEARSAEGEPLPDGEAGELWLRGPTTFAGYWRRPELTARAYRAGWMRTGDLVRIRDGRVYHEGRLDDLIKVGGVWVAPREIEDLLRTHQDVADAAVIETDDGAGVPFLVAFVVSSRSDPSLRRELVRLCRARLAAYKVPRAFEVLDELPRTPSGKLKRFALRGRAVRAK